MEGVKSHRDTIAEVLRARDKEKGKTGKQNGEMLGGRREGVGGVGMG